MRVNEYFAPFNGANKLPLYILYSWHRKITIHLIGSSFKSALNSDVC